MTDHTAYVDACHAAAVKAVQAFLLGTATASTLEGLAEQVEVVEGAMSDLADAVGQVLDAGGELFTGWARLPIQTSSEKGWGL